MTDEFYAMIRKGNTPTPTVDQLTSYTYGRKQPLPFGSKEIPLRWGAIYGAAIGVAAIAGISMLVKKRRNCDCEDWC